MKESKIEIQERKVRNAIRKQAEKIAAAKKQVWDKLSAVISAEIKHPNKFRNWTVNGTFSSMHGLDVEDEIAQDIIANITASKSE